MSSVTGHAERASCVNEMANDRRSFCMRIGVIGTGFIGKTLAVKLSAAGHEVKVANSRGPETIGADLLVSGARAVAAADAVRDVDVVILSIPLNRIPGIAPLIATVPAETVVIDTSNYYPSRDSVIEVIEAGQVESLWVAEQLGRPIVKAWNAIGAHSLAERGTPAGTDGRIAIPVAADDEKARAVGMALVEDTGFDGFDAGTLAQSWRQQPGSPCYCTDLTSDEMRTALAAAEVARLPKRRDLAAAVMFERLEELRSTPEHAILVNRAVFM
ncbi:NADPH-dependent F420 reductase [Nocardia gipuzkoensis]|uniref:NADPH-dependent F420 reductase n=1 Tax=Nocardia abscessus TaxID=120957 RepID=UPI001E2E42AD|nr:NAD(P)-binding domain-containing protein [Nocardia abscessus]